MSYVIIIATLLVLITPENLTLLYSGNNFIQENYMIIPFQPYATVISMEEAIFDSMKLLMQQYLLQTLAIRMLSNMRLNWSTHCTPKNLLAMVATTIF